MSKDTSLLKYSTLILIFLQTCNAWKMKPDYCYPKTPSACGHIRDISYPFHLNSDPEICGDDPKFEFSCEDNQTVMSILSKKLYVQAINYNSKTIHLVDPALQTQDDLCSFSPQLLFFDQSDTIFRSYYSGLRSAEPIFMFNCPSAVNSSSTFLEISGCKLSRYTYLKIGETKVSEVSHGCRMEFIAMTSLPDIKNAENNISHSDLSFSLFALRVILKIVLDWIRSESSTPLLQRVASKFLYIPKASCILFEYTHITIR